MRKCENVRNWISRKNLEPGVSNQKSGNTKIHIDSEIKYTVGLKKVFRVMGTLAF